MSYIDLFKHEVLTEEGIIDLPIYFILESDKDYPTPEFNCEANTLLLGGGSGEHSAIVVRNLSACVSYYLALKYDKFDIMTDDLSDKLYDLHSEQDEISIDCSSLTLKESYNLYKEIENNNKLEICAENWLIYEIGKFIVENHPEKNPILDLTNEVI